ncbi:unnamed protein product, partial [marine sediment metagenome]
AQRHELFGSALTNVEKMSADEFLAGVISLPVAEQVARLENSAHDGQEALRGMDAVHGGGATKYVDSLASMGYESLMPTAPAAVASELMFPDDPAKQARFDAYEAANPAPEVK